MFRRGNRFKGADGLLVSSLGAAFLLIPTQAGASVAPEKTLDQQLLAADAIFFATVTKIHPVTAEDTTGTSASKTTVRGDIQPGETQLQLIELDLGSHRVLANRWPEAPRRIRVRATLEKDDGVRTVEPPHVYEEIRQNGRYLFLLQGGSWHYTPLSHPGKTIFPVRNGEVKCHSGGVYGLTPDGYNDL